MLNKTPLLHQSFGPRVLLSLSLSPPLSLSGYFFGAQRHSEFTFLHGLLRPSREGAVRLHPIERAPEASVNRASPVSGTLLAFCINQGILASFSLLHFLICRLWTTRFRSIKGPQQEWCVSPHSYSKQPWLLSSTVCFLVQFQHTSIRVFNLIYRAKQIYHLEQCLGSFLSVDLIHF